MLLQLAAGRILFSLLSQLKLKFVTVGEKSDFVIDMKMTKNQNKFGVMYYFEKIQLSTSVPVADYNVWNSKDGHMYLCIRHEPSLCEELVKIVAAIKLNHPNLEFKDCNVEAIYVKVKSELGNTIPHNPKLNLALQIYGVFQKNSNGLAYLQMEVIQVNKV